MPKQSTAQPEPRLDLHVQLTQPKVIRLFVALTDHYGVSPDELAKIVIRGFVHDVSRSIPRVYSDGGSLPK